MQSRFSSSRERPLNESPSASPSLRRSPDHFNGFIDLFTAKGSLTISIRMSPGMSDEVPSACRITVLQSVWCARTISNEIVEVAPRLCGAPR